MVRVCKTCSPGISEGPSSRKPPEKTTKSRKSSNVQQKPKSSKKPRICGHSDEPECLAVVNLPLSGEPSNDAFLNSPNFVDHTNENMVDGGPPRFSDLLEQNSASVQEAALDPDMPVPLNQAHPALQKLFPQSLRSYPLNPPVLSITPSNFLSKILVLTEIFLQILLSLQRHTLIFLLWSSLELSIQTRVHLLALIFSSSFFAVRSQSRSDYRYSRWIASTSKGNLQWHNSGSNYGTRLHR